MIRYCKTCNRDVLYSLCPICNEETEEKSTATLAVYTFTNESDIGTLFYPSSRKGGLTNKLENARVFKREADAKKARYFNKEESILIKLTIKEINLSE